MDREKIERIWQAAHRLAELTAEAPRPDMGRKFHDTWRLYEMEVTKQVLQLNQIVIAP